MDRIEIEKIVNEFLTEDLEIDASKIKGDALLADDLRIDSLDLIDVVVIVEKKFGFKINPEEMATVRTLNDFYGFIESKVDK